MRQAYSLHGFSYAKSLVRPLGFVSNPVGLMACRGFVGFLRRRINHPLSLRGSFILDWSNVPGVVWINELQASLLL